jgi:hypothetical protein
MASDGIQPRPGEEGDVVVCLNWINFAVDAGNKPERLRKEK